MYVRQVASVQHIGRALAVICDTTSSTETRFLPFGKVFGAEVCKLDPVSPLFLEGMLGDRLG